MVMASSSQKKNAMQKNECGSGDGPGDECPDRGLRQRRSAGRRANWSMSFTLPFLFPK
jgi:hypothetical protein